MNEENELINKFANNFDLSNMSNIVSFAKDVEERASVFTDRIMKKIRNNQTDNVEELLRSIISEINESNKPKEDVGIWKKLFFKEERESEEINYDRLISNVEALSLELRKYILTLHKDLELLELLSFENINCYKELGLYIEAGKKIIENSNARINEIMSIKNYSDNTKLVNEINDLRNAINIFERKILDLQTTRTVCFQTREQINLLKNNIITLIDKINFIIFTTIPLWKNQIIILHSNDNTSKFVKEYDSISSIIKDVLSSNSSELTKMNIGLRSELEKGIVSSDTLELTSEELIKSLEDVIRLNNENQEIGYSEETDEIKLVL